VGITVLLKYKIGGQHFQPFLDLGGSLNRVVHIDEILRLSEIRAQRGIVEFPRTVPYRSPGLAQRPLRVSSVMVITVTPTSSAADAPEKCVGCDVDGC
jgi:hypothetical protein